ncbi:MAG: hypothetical protein PHH11_13010, partial [Methylomonas sp.]|nr:hypothetical protein [Methylomonas sp.]
RVVCRNDLVALHHHGYTRLTGREPIIFDRQPDNQKLLAKQLGLWLKRAWWQSLTEGDKKLTSEVLTIGFVVHDTCTANSQLTKAIALAENVVSRYPSAECVFLCQDKDWNNIAHLHVLISFSPLFDLRNLKYPRADLRAACFIDEKTSHDWMMNPGLDRFDACLCTEAKLPDGIVQRLPEGMKPIASTAKAQLASLLDPNLLRVLLRIPDSESVQANMAATKLRVALKQQGTLVSEVGAGQWHSLDKVVDVVITLHSQTEETLPHFDRREGVINIIWLLESPETFMLADLELVDELWIVDEHVLAHPGELTPKRRKVEIEEKQLRNIAKTLQKIVEERVGRTFCTP